MLSYRAGDDLSVRRFRLNVSRVIPISAYRDEMGGGLRAPIISFSSLFWMRSSLASRVTLAEPYRMEPYWSLEHRNFL